MLERAVEFDEVVEHHRHLTTPLSDVLGARIAVSSVVRTRAAIALSQTLTVSRSFNPEILQVLVTELGSRSRSTPFSANVSAYRPSPRSSSQALTSWLIAVSSVHLQSVLGVWPTRY